MKAFRGVDGREKMMEGVGNSEARNPLGKFHHKEKQQEKSRLRGMSSQVCFYVSWNKIHQGRIH